MVASRYVSTLLNFAPRPIDSPARGAGSFAAVGLKKLFAISYQLSAAANGRL